MPTGDTHKSPKLTILVPRERFSQFLAIDVDIESNWDQNLRLQGSLVQQLRELVVVAVRKKERTLNTRLRLSGHFLPGRKAPDFLSRHSVLESANWSCAWNGIQVE